VASRVLVALRVATTPERAFAAFTDEIGQWWQPNALFQLTPAGPGVMAFEPGPGGRLVERQPGGGEYEVGRITLWHPPAELAFQWRPASFSPDQSTEVHVRFEPIGDQTRVVVEHTGWDTLAQTHVARHGFPLDATLAREAEWWQLLLSSLRSQLAGTHRSGQREGEVDRKQR
jgi:uncharacterized protein YndB with AHSA1/START domain